MTIIGVLAEHRGGWTDPKLLRRGAALVAFTVGALSGGLLILNVGVTAALALGLGIIVAVTIASDLVSRTSAGWSELRSA